MAGRSGDFKKEDPKLFEPLNARTNNPFKVHKEAHKARVQRLADERREVQQSLWKAAQDEVLMRTARIEDVFAQAVHGVSDRINRAITSADPPSNPSASCGVDLEISELNLNELHGLSVVACVSKNGRLTLSTPENGRIFRSVEASQRGLIDPGSETLHTAAGTQHLIRGSITQHHPSLDDRQPVAIDSGNLVPRNRIHGLGHFREAFRNSGALLFSRHLTPQGWGALVHNGKLILFNSRSRKELAKTDNSYTTRIVSAIASPAEEVMVVSDNNTLHKKSKFKNPVFGDWTVAIDSPGEHPIDISPDGQFLLTRSNGGLNMRNMTDLSLVWSKTGMNGGIFLRDGEVVALNSGERHGLFDTVHSFELGARREFGKRNSSTKSNGEVFQEIPLTGNMVVAAALDEAMNLLKSANFEATWTSRKRGTFEVDVKWKW